MRHVRLSASLVFWSLLIVGLGVAAPAQSAERPVPLIEAVKQGDITLVRGLLQKKVDVNVTQIDGTTAAHWAAHLNNAEILDLLKKAGANFNLTNRYGATPFTLACQLGHVQIIDMLLATGANPNTVLGGEHVLMSAARAGKADAVRSLLRAGADVNYREPERKQTALMWAAAAGHADAVKVLLEAGADMKLRSKSPPQPIPNGNRANIPRVNDPLGLRALRDGSYSVNVEGQEFTALLWAARGGHIEAARVLLDNGADPNEGKTDDGTTALNLAVGNLHWELANLLVNRGADPNRGPGFTSLHLLAWSRRLNDNSTTAYTTPPEPTGTLSSLELAKNMLAHGAQVNARMTRSFRDGLRNRLNRLGATAFLLSSKLVDVPMVRLLAANGADMTILNEDFDTPLMLAAGVALHNPTEDAGNEAETLATVQLLLDLGADVNARNRNNETALHGASYRGFAPVTTLLYERGAKLGIKNVIDWTEVTIADGVFYTGFVKAAPHIAELLRTFYAKSGLPVPPPPGGGNDYDVLTLNKDQDVAYKKELEEAAKRAQEASKAAVPGAATTPDGQK